MNLLTLVILRHFIAKKKQMYPSFIHAHGLLTLFYIVQTHTFKVLKEQAPFCVATLSTPGFLVRSDLLQNTPYETYWFGFSSFKHIFPSPSLLQF